MDENGLLSDIFETRYFGTTRCRLLYRKCLDKILLFEEIYTYDATLISRDFAQKFVRVENSYWNIILQISGTITTCKEDAMYRKL